MAFIKESSAISFKYDSETLRVESWGPNAFRVRATHQPVFPAENWALEEPVIAPNDVSIEAGETASIKNGNITATISARGKLLIFNNKTGKPILEEFSRHRLDLMDPKSRFESLDAEERIYGMGQYQQPFMNLKGAQLELAQRNSQASVPFAVSSLGYGFLWNNPSIGRAVFGTNVTTFEASSTNIMDYWIVTGDSPSDIVRAYTDVTGKSQRCPNVIVVDFFHWPKEGEWKFDPTFWPDPETMIKELKSLDIECMVSVWPTVDRQSENYSDMLSQGLLIHQDRGWRISMEDEAEPEYTVYDFDIYRYYRGPNLMIGNWYPRDYSRGFYEGMKASGQDKVVNLVRCAWAGSQRYGALLWSGDIASSWGAANEVWSYGEEVYQICKTYLALREKMKDYIRELMKAAHIHGDPLMRPLFYDFPQDEKAWRIEDEYMFGWKYLVAPVLKAGQMQSTVYLPKGKQWRLVSAQGEATGTRCKEEVM
ncbi:unnamed protein product [Parascedosporium putredinis]|uniref:Glycoside hydrolase family 31 protein n=1 Tax=Parascedosporium putredinis TaxID=1442378 RepID=A0A9P1H0V2_9PEZI|nr:unnamed protein product [Parascedosporium putredinis]CAI7993149.1 unnamed protein product [Parascedosporium putredinis]